MTPIYLITLLDEFPQRYGILFAFQNIELSFFREMGRNKQIIHKKDKVTAEMLRGVCNQEPLVVILPNIKAVNSAKSLISQLKDGMWQIKSWGICDSEDWLVQIKRMG